MSRKRVALVTLAAIGASLFLVVIVNYWRAPGDNLAYWIAGQRIVAGQPIYSIGEEAFAPYAYHYPPPLAQLLAPLTVVIPTIAYLVIYRALLVLATWELAGRRMLPMLALIAFLPVAIALRFENVDLLLALGIVLGLGRWPWLFALGAVVKVSPGLGIVYLALQRRWRDVLFSCVVGGVIIAVSLAAAPDLWRAWLDAIQGRSDMIGNSLLPVPYFVRVVAGLAVTIAGGLLGRRPGELLLVAGVTLANPGLAVNGLAVLAAAVPIWFAGPGGVAAAASRAGDQRA